VLNRTTSHKDPIEWEEKPVNRMIPGGRYDSGEATSGSGKILEEDWSVKLVLVGEAR
jgi:hypothetical protein